MNLVKIPLDKELYSLYLKSFITDSVFDPEEGTLAEIEGSGVAFYRFKERRGNSLWTVYRNAYIFTGADCKEIPAFTAELPLFKYPVKILYQAEGRKFDILYRAVWNLEDMFGKEVYGFPPHFWLELGALTSLTLRKKDRGTRRNVMLLAKKYGIG